MKVLYINSQYSDYLQDIVFSGLIKLLGSVQITHWPFSTKFVLPIEAYPKNIGQNNRAWLTASPFSPNPNSYDVIFVASCKKDTFKSFLKIAKNIPLKTKVIFIDGGDREDLGGDLLRVQHGHLWEEACKIRPFDIIFKREYIIGKTYDRNVFPLPFGYNLSRLPNLSNIKKYGVSFWAVESHPIRTEALRLIKDLFDCATNGTGLNQKFSLYKRKGDYYLRELNACKIVLNFRGGGWDTLRYWETPAVGTLMISQKPQIEIPNNFQHEKHVVFCQDDLSDLLDLCKFYLKNDNLRHKIENAGFQHLLEHHTDVARAKEVLKHIH